MAADTPKAEAGEKVVKQAEPAVLTGLCGSAIEKDWLENKLKSVFKTNANFGEKFEAIRIGYGQGFMSIMAKIICDWQGEGAENLPSRLVLKIPTLATMIQVNKESGTEEVWKEHNVDIDLEKFVEKFTAMLRLLHASETQFYKIQMRDNLQLNVPKCYLSQDFNEDGEQGLLVLEDLSEKAAVKIIYEGLSVESLKQVFANLAEVHAWSLTHDEWRSNKKLQVSFIEVQKATGGEFEQMTKGSLSYLKSTYPEMFDPFLDRVIKEVNENFNFGDIENANIAEELGVPTVFTHGDLWMNNIMWKKTEDGKGTTDTLEAIIDWQVGHASSVGEDFARLLCSSVSPEIRRNHLDELIAHYHTTLAKKLGKDPPFTVEQVKESYRRLFKFGVMMILPAFAAFVMEGYKVLGTENVEENKQKILNRVKAIIEDMYAIDDGKA